MSDAGSPLLRGSESALEVDVLTEVVKCVSVVLKVDTVSVVSPQNIQSVDERIRKCFAAFPPHYQLTATEYLDPQIIIPVLYLQDTRLSFHRRNLSPTCAMETRYAAIDSCVSISRDTTRTLSRTMRHPAELVNVERPSTIWQKSMRSIASAFFCLHLWRCALFLCFQGDYQAALVCTRVSAAIGDARSVNPRCGRYLDFFLRSLHEPLQRGERSQLERNEDVMAYVSSDLQNRSESAWIWQHEDHSALQRDQRSTNDPTFSLKPGEASQDWNGWDEIINRLERLLEEQRRGVPGAFLTGRSPLQRDPTGFRTRNDPTNVVISPGGSNRISIADIM